MAPFDPKHVKVELLPHILGHPDAGTKRFSKGGKAWAVQAGGRPILMVNYKGVRVPFYQSTGTGSKKNTVPGHWYPFFGVTGGWVNKTHGSEMAKHYGSEHLKGIAETLNKHVNCTIKEQHLCPNFLRPSGTINSDTGHEIMEVDPKHNLPKGGVHKVDDPQPAFDEHINSAMPGPVAKNDSDKEAVVRNIKIISDKLDKA